MKNIFWASLFFCTVSCGKKADEAKISAIDSTVINSPDSTFVSINQEFLNAFKTVNFDILSFSSPENPAQPLRGARRIGANEVMLFPKFFKVGNPDKPEIFALSKFDINKDNYGLIVQSPGDFNLSSVNLLVYNKLADGIIATIEIADRTSEKGYKSEKKSWFVRDSAGVKGLLNFATSLEPVDATDLTRPSKTNDYYWIKFRKDKIDTMRVSQSEMPEALKIMKKSEL